MELLLVHDAGEAEVGNQEVCVVLGGAEKEVFGFEVAVHNAMVMQVSDGGEDSADEIGGVGFVVGPFAADAIEKLPAEGKVGDEVYCAAVSSPPINPNPQIEKGREYDYSWSQSSRRGSGYSGDPWTHASARRSRCAPCARGRP